MDQRLQDPVVAAPPDWRGLCEELYRAFTAHARTDKQHDLLDCVQLALAQPEPEVVGPTDEELLELTEDWPATTGPRHDLSGCPEVPLYSVFADEVVEFARAVLARWGHPAPAPAEGEVAELVRSLRDEASEDDINDHLMWMSSADARRAADLLKRQAAPVPVAVSERLPQAEDCDAEGRCWWFLPSRQFKFLDQCARWSLMAHSASQDDRCRRTHWLPAYALPIPGGEVEA